MRCFFSNFPRHLSAVLSVIGLLLCLQIVAGCSDGLGRFTPVRTCTPACDGRECGTDGCNGTCGTCPGIEFCEPLSGSCIFESDYRVDGSIHIEYMFGNVNGDEVILSGPGTVPGTGILIHVVDGDGIVIGAGHVEGLDGSFSVPVSRPLTGTETAFFSTMMADDDGMVLLAVIDPASDDLDLSYNTFDPYSWFVEIPEHGDLGNINVRTDQYSGALYVFLMNRLAFENIVLPLTETHSELNLVPLAVFFGPWEDYVVPCTCYHGDDVDTYIGDADGPRLQAKISVVDSPGDSSAWGWAVLFHEFGHYILGSYAKDNSPGGYHYIGETLEPVFAFSEGWATFMSLVTATVWFDELWPFYWDIQGGNWFFVDFLNGGYESASTETRHMVFPELTGASNQRIDENWLARTLYLIWDGSESSNNINETMTLEQMLDTVVSDRFLKGFEWAPKSDLYNFLDSALCFFPEKDPALADRVLLEFAFPYTGDPRCVQYARVKPGSGNIDDNVIGPASLSEKISRYRDWCVRNGGCVPPVRQLPEKVIPVTLNGVVIESAIRLNSE